MAKKEKQPTNKIKQAEYRKLMRSLITLAEYNPRKISDDARKLLKQNLKKNGLMGGIVWNETTGRLVSGHQRISIIDEVNHYNPQTHENDYPITVEAVALDEITEKEQNLFMNNRNVQGEFDNDMLKDMLKDINYEYAGFSEFDLDMLGMYDYEPTDVLNTVAPADDEPDTSSMQWRKEDVTENNTELEAYDQVTKTTGEDKSLKRDVNFHQDSAENQVARHNEVQKIKDRINKQNDYTKDGGALSYVIVSFPSPMEKEKFMNAINADPFGKFIDSEYLLERIDVIDLNDVGDLEDE